jgi:membrane fusion protein (multidrug efflux system)
LRTQVRAPFAGKVGLLKVDQGQWLSAGQVIGQMVSESPVRLEAAMPEARAAWIQVGQKLSWKAGKDSGKARVDALEPYLDAQTRTRSLRAKVEGKTVGLLPGFSVELQLERDTTPVLTVPSQALSGDVRGILVWVARGGKSFPVPVETGRRAADRIEIRSGLNPGDTVIMPGSSTLKPDGNVEIVRILSEVRR